MWWLDKLSICSDACLKSFDGEEYPVHKVVLQNVSQFFEVLFHHSLHPTVTIKDVQKATLDVILKYIYTGQLVATINNMHHVLYAADYLVMENLLESCVQFIEDNITLESCIQLYITALELPHLALDNFCYRYIQRNFERIIKKTCNIQLLPHSSLATLLEDDYLNIASENTVWKAIVAWVEGDVEARQEVVYDLLSYLRFRDLDQNYVENAILENRIIRKNPECCRKINEHRYTNKNGGCNENNWWNRLGLKCVNTKHRKPKSIHFFVELTFEFYDDNFEGCLIYEIYDDSFDYWRHIGAHEGFVPDHIHVIKDILYLFDTLRGIHFAFNVRTQSWIPLSSLEEDKYEYSVVMVDEMIYAVGGVRYEPRFQPMKSVDVYNFELNTWFPVESMHNRHLGLAVELNEKIYVAGDYFDELHNMYVLSCEYYTPESDKWQMIKAPHFYRRNFAMIGYKGCLYLIGGQSNRSDITTTEIYDPVTDSWRFSKHIPQTFTSPKATIVQGVLVVFENCIDTTHCEERAKALAWEDDKQDWIEAENSRVYNKLSKFLFGVVDDAETVQEVRQYSAINTEYYQI